MMLVELPQQSITFDCDIYVISYMQMWDEVKTYEEGLTMPYFTKIQVTNMRCKLLCEWAMHPKNGHKSVILHKAIRNR
ncbi:hypothetical protein RIF29_10253 [Crotalaria pallida]|uniref:Uncharacterized protein n=1 Tax=Crotalaria pallida TaxID=3830 RepID=A0AAN9FYT1_CROPI